MKLVISSEELEILHGSELWVRLVDGFLLTLKSLIAEEIHQVHNVPRQVSLDLVRIRNYDYTSFEVGIIDSKSYSRSHKNYLVKVLRSEYGSASDNEQSVQIIVTLIRSIKSNIKYLWNDYVATEVNING